MVLCYGFMLVFFCLFLCHNVWALTGVGVTDDLVMFSVLYAMSVMCNGCHECHKSQVLWVSCVMCNGCHTCATGVLWVC